MMKHQQEIKIALIDMNKGLPNQGIKSILGILSSYQKTQGINLDVQLFDLRAKNEIPGLEHDIYISSGGGGSPFDGKDQQWERSFFELLDRIESFNAAEKRKKHVFLICHSFQLACRKYGIGNVLKRESTAFGIFPIKVTPDGETDTIFAGLDNPLYVVDSRNWQVVEPSSELAESGTTMILAYEDRSVETDQAPCIMSIRFSDAVVGTQFHPEAGNRGMKTYLLNTERKAEIIEANGEECYTEMLQSLENPKRIAKTKLHIIPNFLTKAIQSLNS